MAPGHHGPVRSSESVVSVAATTYPATAPAAAGADCCPSIVASATIAGSDKSYPTPDAAVASGYSIPVVNPDVVAAVGAVADSVAVAVTHLPHVPMPGPHWRMRQLQRLTSENSATT